MKQILAALAITFFLGNPIIAQTTASSDSGAIAAALSDVPKNLDAFKRNQFQQYDANFDLKRAARVIRLRALAKEVFAREAAGQDVQCPHKILIELRWLITATADFKRLDQRLDDLSDMLAAPSSRPQMPPCLTLWFYQLDFAYNDLQDDRHFQFPTELLDRINSPQKLSDYFTSVSVSDIAHEGIDHEEELNEPLADLIRMVIRDNQPTGYAYAPGLNDSFHDLILHKLRDPVTGYWGERYVTDGRTLFVPDLSTTFHIVSYLKGEVPDMDKVVETTLLLKDRDTPVGWLYNGQQYNHNAMDVVRIFKWGWADASDDQKKQIAIEIQKLIDRCLSESLQPNGSFKHLTADSSIEEATYFGVVFLADAGFFDKSKRFWTDRDFPGAEPIRQKLITFIQQHQKAGAAGGGFYQSALEALGVRSGK
jgi:hypothetical protein